MVEVFEDKERPLQKSNFVFSSLFASHLFLFFCSVNPPWITNASRDFHILPLNKQKQCYKRGEKKEKRRLHRKSDAHRNSRGEVYDKVIRHRGESAMRDEVKSADRNVNRSWREEKGSAALTVRARAESIELWREQQKAADLPWRKKRKEKWI